jgi:hypothetical protein
MLPILKFPPFFQGQMGVPGSESPLGVRTRPQGVVFYVDQNHPLCTDDNDGVNADAPCETIMGAYGHAVDGRGDVIRVMPGTYTEDLIFNKDFLTLEGCLTGYGRPDVEALTAQALRVHAQGFVCSQMRFVPVTANNAVDQQGNGFLYFDCVFEGDGADDFALFPDLNDDHYTASEGVLLGNLFRSGNVGLRFINPGPPAGVGPTDVQVIGNRFYNHTTNDIVCDDTPGSNGLTFTDCLIAQNFFMEVGAAFVYMDLSDGALNSGLVCGNYFADADVIAAQMVLVAGIIQAGNYDTAGFVAI